MPLAMAKKARERHRLVVDLLIAVGAPREAAEADAEGVDPFELEASGDPSEPSAAALRGCFSPRASSSPC